MISVQPNDVVDALVDVSNHRTHPTESDDRKKLLILVYVTGNCDLHSITREFLTAGTMLV